MTDIAITILTSSAARGHGSWSAEATGNPHQRSQHRSCAFRPCRRSTGLPCSRAATHSPLRADARRRRIRRRDLAQHGGGDRQKRVLRLDAHVERLEIRSRHDLEGPRRRCRRRGLALALDCECARPERLPGTNGVRMETSVSLPGRNRRVPPGTAQPRSDPCERFMARLLQAGILERSLARE